MPTPGSKGFLEDAVVHEIPRRDGGTGGGSVVKTVSSLHAHHPAARTAFVTVFYGDPKALLPPPDVAHEAILGRSIRPPQFVHRAADLELLLLRNALARSRTPQRHPGVSVRRSPAAATPAAAFGVRYVCCHQTTKRKERPGPPNDLTALVKFC